MMDLHPGESPRRFRVHTDPITHVYLANAVTLAYSAIEEWPWKSARAKRTRRRCPMAHGIPALRRMSRRGCENPVSTFQARQYGPCAAQGRASKNCGLRHSRKTELVTRQRARRECPADRRLGARQLAAKLDDHASIHRHRPQSYRLRRSQCPGARPSSHHGEVRILAKTHEAAAGAKERLIGRPPLQFLLGEQLVPAQPRLAIPAGNEFGSRLAVPSIGSTR